MEATERKTDSGVAVWRAVTQALARALSVRDGASAVLRTICEQLDWELGLLWVVDDEANTLRAMGVWQRPPLSPADGMRLSAGIQLAAGMGLPGQVWVYGEPFWGEVPEPSDFARTKVAEELGLRGAFGLPIRRGEEILGVVELFTTGGRDRKMDLETLETVAAQLAEFVKRNDAEDRFRQAERKYRALVEQIPAIIYTSLADDAMTTLYISPQVQTLLGVAPDEWLAERDLWYKHLHPEDRDRALAEYARGRDSGQPFSLEYRMISRDGRIVWFRDEAVVLPDAEGPGLVHGVMLDITERRRAEEQAAFLAYHDKLTGLPNRAMFDELLDLALARARRHDVSVAVLLMDLDNFKLVNDSLGHAAGDELLRQIAFRLREATRETDLVARQGGDEFLLLLSDLDRRGPLAVGQEIGNPMLVVESVVARIQDVLAPPFVLGTNEFYVSASVGISLYPQDADHPDALLKNADAAMYQSKKAGPGGYCVFSKMTPNPVGKLSLSTRLRRAVEREQWILHYQPVIDLMDGHAVGVEALLRWREPDGGLIQPSEFIPLAEEMGLIEAIGDWVLKSLCEQAKDWGRQGLDLEVGFNLSPRQLWQPDLVNRIVGTVHDTGLDPARFVVEITESTVMTDPSRTHPILAALHGEGFRIAIDDFGVGYSSLSRLKHLPIDVLKIDQSFIRDVPDQQDAGSMVKAIVELARSLGMRPLAEGIETREQWRFLVGLNCQLGQGFYFSQPVPADAIAARFGQSVIRTPLRGFRDADLA